MLTKIAWMNIWRNKTRSAILITAISLGIWALIFINGLSIGMVRGYIDKAILERTSHIQIHHPAYIEEPEIAHFYQGKDVITYLDTARLVQAYSSRIVAQGMISSAQSSRGITLYGVDPTREKTLTNLDMQVEEGEYLPEEGGNYILIGDKIAEKLGVKLRSRVVVNFQNTSGDVTAAAFRVAGIIGGRSTMTGDDAAYIPFETLQKLTEMEPGMTHEIAILLHDQNEIEAFEHTLVSEFDDLSIRDYGEIAPDVVLMGSQIDISLTIMTVVFMLALIFGIINTMLMAVLERYKELGMLLAVGMKKMQVFALVVWETIFLSMIGVPVGIILGSLTILITGRQGISLAQWSDSLTEFGLSTMIYPELYPRQYIIISLAVLITAVLASLYPARKATSLNPIEALRKI